MEIVFVGSGRIHYVMQKAAAYLRKHLKDVSVKCVNTYKDPFWMEEINSSVDYLIVHPASCDIGFLTECTKKMFGKVVIWNHLNPTGFATVVEGLLYLQELIKDKDKNSKATNNWEASNRIIVAGITQEFCTWWNAISKKEIAYLPVMYPVDEAPVAIAPVTRSKIHIGVVGEIRLLKNNFGSVAAVVAYAEKKLGKEVVLYVQKKTTYDGNSSKLAIDVLCGKSSLTLIWLPWMDREGFHQFLPRLDLIVNLSYSEAFATTVAEGINAGVISLVSTHSADWIPNFWKISNLDDMPTIVERMENLIGNTQALIEGANFLEIHNKNALLLWKTFLGI